jgi:uncharacterized phiE125 gp8 family phage protein
MGLKLITPPATTPVSLAEAKAHVEYEDTDRDALITGLIQAATDYVEQFTGKALVSQTWRLTLDGFSNTIALPKGPVISVSSVQYFDANGDLQTVGAGDYMVDTVSDPAWLVLNSDASWPAVVDGINAVSINFVAGYTILPASIKQAILLLIGQWFDNRSATSEKAMTEVPYAVESLLRPFRPMLV